MNDVVVIGSLNMDLVVRVQNMPAMGETVRGSDLLTIPGGKGANQAAAAARLGNRVVMVGRVGTDEFGSALITSLNHAGVHTERVLRDQASVTGTAMITVDERGNNCIVISPGANGRVAIEDVTQAEDLINSARFVLLQLEIPLKTVECAVEAAHRANVPVILNPAPAMALPAHVLKMVQYLVLNETEATTISGIQVCDIQSAEQAAQELLRRGVENAILTLGAAGSVLATQDAVHHVPALEVEVVDTTAAGDAFIGGFVSGLMRGFSALDAVRYGNCAGGVTVTRKGAQTSLPDKATVDGLFASVQH